MINKKRIHVSTLIQIRKKQMREKRKERALIYGRCQLINAEVMSQL